MDNESLQGKYNRLLDELDAIKREKVKKGSYATQEKFNTDLKLMKMQFKLREILDVKIEMRYGPQKPKVIVRTPEQKAMIEEIYRMRKKAGLPD